MVQFRFYKPEIKKTNRTQNKKNPSQTGKNRAKPSKPKKPSHTGLNRFRFGFGFFLKKIDLVIFL
jgi:hypothetical protein